MSDDLRERLAAAVARHWNMDEPDVADLAIVDDLLPVVTAYAERESDARAEAAHKAGYEQGQRDALEAAAKNCDIRARNESRMRHKRTAENFAEVASYLRACFPAPDPHPGGSA